MPTCPDGHDSSADDYCSTCGLAIAGAASSPTIAAPTSTPSPATGGARLACPNCAETHGRDDVFCENCGYDFVTGSLPLVEPAITLTPSATSSPASTSTTSAAPAEPSAGAATVLAEITLTVDADHHERMDTDRVLALPDPMPAPRAIPVVSPSVLVGRPSPSRGIHPDIDLSDDPAASSRHARFDRADDGTWTITDLGSTNGTYLGDDDTELGADVTTPLPPGTAVYVGAWTKLVLVPLSDDPDAAA